MPHRLAREAARVWAVNRKRTVSRKSRRRRPTRRRSRPTRATLVAWSQPGNGVVDSAASFPPGDRPASPKHEPHPLFRTSRQVLQLIDEMHHVGPSVRRTFTAGSPRSSPALKHWSNAFNGTCLSCLIEHTCAFHRTLSMFILSKTPWNSTLTCNVLPHCTGEVRCDSLRTDLLHKRLCSL